MKVNKNESKLVDRLFELEAQKKPVQDEIDAIKAKLKNVKGDTDYRGTKGYVLVSMVFNTRIDYKKIVAKLNPSRQMLASYTSKSTSLRVKLNGYNDSKRAA